MLLLSATVWDGVYTSDQALRGSELFAGKCQGCHNYESLGGPESLPLKGPQFFERWREYSLDVFFNAMSTTMPKRADALPENEYLDILAYLLQANEFPAGTAALQKAGLSGIQLTGRNGPQPLPSTASVRAVGCLSAGANGAWNLSNATGLIRIRNAEETSPADLKAAAAAAPGTQTYVLRGLDQIARFGPDAHKGEKLQVQGVLSRQGTVERINVLSVEVVGRKCS